VTGEMNDQNGALRSAVLWIVSYLALHLTLPRIVFPSVFWASVLATVLFLAVSLGIVYSATRVPTHLGLEVALLSGCALSFIGCDAAGAEEVSELFLMLAGILFGKIVSRLIKERNLLLPVAAVAALVDIWGVNCGGPVSQAVAKAPSLFSKMTAQIPSFSTGAAGAPKPVALIGVGDFAFLALFFASLQRFDLNVGAAAWLAGAMLCVGMLLVVLAPANIALPGLPFMVAGVLLPNAGKFHYTHAEKVALLYGGVAIAFLLGLASMGMRLLK